LIRSWIKPAAGVGAGQFCTVFSYCSATPNGEAISGYAAVSGTGGTLTITYLVTHSDTTTASFNPDVPVYYSFAPNAFSAAQSAMTVLEGYAPQQPVTSITNYPAFAVQTATPAPVTTVGLCSTSLLFPFVTNQLGFDTGLVLANTSQDPFSTTPASGTCSLNFYGQAAPSAAVNAPGGSQAGGTTNAFLLSSVAPGFQGYMIATCSFNFGHGFAYIAYDLTQNNGAQVECYEPRSLAETSGWR
jgi:hypothetical protein